MGTYIVWCEDLGQEQSDGKKLAEAGPREAAQEWARWQDHSSAEYSIVGGAEMVVSVYDEGSGDRTHWRVTGEAVPEYRARPVTPKDAIRGRSAHA